MEEVARNAAITGQFLSREELAEAAAPDPADVQAVEEYARRQRPYRRGCQPRHPPGEARRFRSRGQQAFGVSLDRYEHQGTTFRGRTGPVLVPESLAAVIVGVLGTDDRPMAHRLTTVAPQFVSGHSVPMTAVQLASYYQFRPVSTAPGSASGSLSSTAGTSSTTSTGTSRSSG